MSLTKWSYAIFQMPTIMIIFPYTLIFSKQYTKIKRFIFLFFKHLSKTAYFKKRHFARVSNQVFSSFFINNTSNSSVTYLESWVIKMITISLKWNFTAILPQIVLKHNLLQSIDLPTEFTIQSDNFFTDSKETLVKVYLE